MISCAQPAHAVGAITGDRIGRPVEGVARCGAAHRQCDRSITIPVAYHIGDGRSDGEEGGFEDQHAHRRIASQAVSDLQGVHPGTQTCHLRRTIARDRIGAPIVRVGGTRTTGGSCGGRAVACTVASNRRGAQVRRDRQRRDDQCRVDGDASAAVGHRDEVGAAAQAVEAVPAFAQVISQRIGPGDGARGIVAHEIHRYRAIATRGAGGGSVLRAQHFTIAIGDRHAQLCGTSLCIGHDEDVEARTQAGHGAVCGDGHTAAVRPCIPVRRCPTGNQYAGFTDAGTAFTGYRAQVKRERRRFVHRPGKDRCTAVQVGDLHIIRACTQPEGRVGAVATGWIRRPIVGIARGAARNGHHDAPVA